MRLVPMLLPLLLAACAYTKYEKAGVDQQQAMGDQQACRYEAEKATAPGDNPFDEGMHKTNIVYDCMTLKGYKPVD